MTMTPSKFQTFHRRALLIGAMSLALLSSGAAWPQARNEPIRIGALFSTTGILAPYGSDTLPAAQIVIDELNAAGGINKRLIELIAVDDESRPERAVALAKRLIQRDKVVAVAGPMSTIVSASLSPIFNESKIPALGCICFLGKITPYEFSMFPLEGLMETQIKFAKTNRVTKVGVISQAGSLAELVKNTQVPVLEKGGLTIVGFEQMQQNDTDVTPLLARLRSAGAELIFAGLSGTTTTLVAKNFKQMAYPGLFWTYGGNASKTFIDLVGSAGDIVNMGGYKILVYKELPDSDPQKLSITRFAEKFIAKTGREPGIHAAFGHDTAVSLIEAIKVAGDDPVKIRDALENQKNLQVMNGVINRNPGQHNGLLTDYVPVRIDPVKKAFIIAK
jgi:branched-chain amino acid transport system substrate-binding protein